MTQAHSSYPGMADRFDGAAAEQAVLDYIATADSVLAAQPVQFPNQCKEANRLAV